MARPCSICISKHRAAVDYGLTLGVPHDTLARRYALSKDAIFRHARAHLSPNVKAAILAGAADRKMHAEAVAELHRSEAEGILTSVVTARARLQVVAEQAVRTGDLRAAVAAESALAQNLALAGKLVGQLGVVTHQHQHLTVTPDFLAARQVIMDALRPHPEARAAVAAALLRLEVQAADNIMQRAHGAPSATTGPLLIEGRAVPPPPGSPR